MTLILLAKKTTPRLCKVVDYSTTLIRSPYFKYTKNFEPRYFARYLAKPMLQEALLIIDLEF